MADKEKLIKLLHQAPCESDLEGRPGSCPYRKYGRCGEVDRLDYCAVQRLADRLIANGVVVLPLGGIGEMSDGYHTFNELYHHRAVLFSVICNARPDLAWKSKLHDTGDMYEGMFIVGIETKEGQATYHYDIAPYWDMFNVPVLDRAPVWDGHTPQQAIDRIASGVVVSKMETTTKWIPVTERLPEVFRAVLAYCPNGGNIYEVYLNARSEWHFFDETVAGAVLQNTATHWMPMPEPPKGE